MLARRRPLSVAAACATLILATGCGGETADPDAGSPSPSASETPTETPSETPTGTDGLAMTCTGSTGPVVVLEAGLDTSADTFEPLVEALGDQRVCLYDRAGVGLSPPLPQADPDPWPGTAADALAETLTAQGQEPPYVMLGWSYGGMVAQAFAVRHPDLVAGLVFEDSSVPEQFVDRVWQGIDWVDGGRPVDKDTTVAELSTVDLGELPVLVLTANSAPPGSGRLWLGYHRRLAASTTDAVHLEALGSGHVIHEDALDLVAAAVRAVVAAADGAGLEDCDARFRKVGGRCLT